MNGISSIKPPLIAPVFQSVATPALAQGKATQEPTLAAEPAAASVAGLNPLAGTGQDQKPAASANPEPELPEKRANALQDGVERANAFVQSLQRDLHFTLDMEAEQMVVKVLDSASGELIRQIPNEAFLEMVKKIKAVESNPDTQDQGAAIRLLDAQG
jgi:flagellar protein FlaG